MSRFFRSHLLLAALPLAFGLSLIALFVVPAIYQENQENSEHGLAYELKSENWQVLYNPPLSSSFARPCKSLGDCGMSDVEIWRSAESRDWHAHPRKLSKSERSFYWMKYTIPRKDVVSMPEESRNILYLGSISDRYDLFINGKQVRSEFNDVRNVLYLPFETESITDQGVEIVLRIGKELGGTSPDYMVPAGLASREQVRSLLRFSELHSRFLKSAGFGVAIAIGFILTILWLISPKRQELAALAGLAYFNAYMESVSVPLIWDQIGISSSVKLLVVSAWYESSFVLVLGFAMARIKGLRVALIAAFSFLFPWLLVSLNFTSITVHGVSYAFKLFLLPAAHFTSALICLWEAQLVTARHKHQLIDPGRLPKLHFSWVLFSTLGVIAFVALWFQIDLMKTYQFIFLIGFSLNVIHDFRRQELESRVSMSSTYHQRAYEQGPVDCVLGIVDIKRSETLFGPQSNLGSMEAVIEKLCQKIVRKGGEIAYINGDEVVFLFDVSRAPQRIEDVLGFVDEVHREFQLLQVAAGSSDDEHLHFRSAFLRGQVLPAWQTAHNRRVPVWKSIEGQSNPFVELARLMEAESKVSNRGQSTVVLSESLSFTTLPERHGLVWKKPQLVAVKHDRSISVVVGTLDSFGAA